MLSVKAPTAIYVAGPYIIHRGKLSLTDAQYFWIEGTTLDGRRAPVGVCWDEASALEFVRKRGYTALRIRE